MTVKLTPTQQAALDRIKKDGVLYPGDGVSVATVRVLEGLDLVEVTWKPPTHHYGALGPAGGRGYWSANWSARPKPDP